MNKIIEDLNWRYACKKFDASKKISDKDFEIILESLRLTASSFGLQPWKFVVVKNVELREKLVAASWNQQQVKDASHLIVLCAPSYLDEKFVTDYVEDTAKTKNVDVSELAGFQKMLMMIPNKKIEDQMIWSKNQIYIALGNLLNTCAQLRIDSCPMEGFKPSEYDQILGLGEFGLKSVLVCPVGYRDSADKYITQPKVRYPLNQLVIEI